MLASSTASLRSESLQMYLIHRGPGVHHNVQIHSLQYVIAFLAWYADVSAHFQTRGTTMTLGNFAKATFYCLKSLYGMSTRNMLMRISSHASYVYLTHTRKCKRLLKVGRVRLLILRAHLGCCIGGTYMVVLEGTTFYSWLIAFIFSSLACTGYLDPTMWKETKFGKSPFQEFTDDLSGAKVIKSGANDKFS